MGAVASSAGAADIAAELACCACSSVSGFLFKDSATRAKFRYFSFLLVAMITCFVMLMPGIRGALNRIPNFCHKIVSDEVCDRFVGFDAVYRTLFSVAAFHLLLAILTFKVTKINSFRARINNELWILKILLILILVCGAFFVPRKSTFFRVWMYISLSGGFVFIMYQIILIIDFGHSWSMSWAEKLETSTTKLWYVAMAISTLIMFSLSGAAVFCFFYYFTSVFDLRKCRANFFYISFIVIQCLLATVISIVPSVQQELTGTGLLQSSVVILYTVYLTWNTLSSEPDAACNPLGKVILEYDKMSGVNAEAVFGCILTFALLTFACTVRAHTSHLTRYGLALSESEEYALELLLSDKEKHHKSGLEEGEELRLDDYVGYNYSFFHLIMVMVSLQMVMLITNWHSPEDVSDMRRLVKNWASVWVQMASSFMSVLVYVWFLVAPLIKRLWGPFFGLPSDNRNNYLEYKRILDTYDTGNDIIGPLPTNLRRRNTEGAVRSLPQKPQVPTVRRSSVDSYFERPKNSDDTKPNQVNDQGNLNGDPRTSEPRTDHRPYQKYTMNDTFTTYRHENAPRHPAQVESKIPYNDETNRQGYEPYREDGRNHPHNKGRSERWRGSNISITSGISAISAAASRFREKLVKSAPRLRNDKGRKGPEFELQEEYTKEAGKIANYCPPSRYEERSEVRYTSNKEMLPGERTISVVPSIFKEQPQDSAVAREILKYQWKILRLQAKVVKIQERIIRVQAETAIENGGELPIGQSSVVGYEPYIPPHKNNIYKENGLKD